MSSDRPPSPRPPPPLPQAAVLQAAGSTSTLVPLQVSFRESQLLMPLSLSRTWDPSDQVRVFQPLPVYRLSCLSGELPALCSLQALPCSQLQRMYDSDCWCWDVGVTQESGNGFRVPQIRLENAFSDFKRWWGGRRKRFSY